MMLFDIVVFRIACDVIVKVALTFEMNIMVMTQKRPKKKKTIKNKFVFCEP
jgi:hypothetical protein